MELVSWMGGVTGIGCCKKRSLKVGVQHKEQRQNAGLNGLRNRPQSLAAHGRCTEHRTRKRVNGCSANPLILLWSYGESNPGPLECHSSATGFSRFSSFEIIIDSVRI